VFANTPRGRRPCGTARFLPGPGEGPLRRRPDGSGRIATNRVARGSSPAGDASRSSSGHDRRVTSAAEKPRAVAPSPATPAAPVTGPVPTGSSARERAPDVLVGAAALAVAGAAAVGRRGRAVGAPVLRWTGRPPLVPERWTPAHACAAMVSEVEQ